MNLSQVVWPKTIRLTSWSTPGQFSLELNHRIVKLPDQLETQPEEVIQLIISGFRIISGWPWPTLILISKKNCIAKWVNFGEISKALGFFWMRMENGNILMEYKTNPKILQHIFEKTFHFSYNSTMHHILHSINIKFWFQRHFITKQLNVLTYTYQIKTKMWISHPIKQPKLILLL